MNVRSIDAMRNAHSARSAQQFESATRLNVRHVECFRTVMSVGTVTAAAEVLHTSQPAISRSIQQFEDAIGLRLFDRVRGRLVPTAHAQSLYDEVRKTFLGLDHISRVAAHLKSFQSGNISIVCAPMFSHEFIAEVARRFLAQHRFVSLSIDIQRSAVIGELLNAQRFDLGLAAYPLAPPGAVAETFAEPEEVCVLPPGHPLAAREIIRPSDLAEIPFIFVGSGNPYRYRLDKIFEDALVKRRLVIETANYASLCSMVLKGAGAGIVNLFTALEFVDRGLVIRPFVEKLPFTTTLLQAKHRPSSPLVELFIEQLKMARDDYIARCAALDLRPAKPGANIT